MYIEIQGYVFKDEDIKKRAVQIERIRETTGPGDIICS